MMFSLAVIGEKPLVHVSHLAIMLLTLSEMDRKLKKRPKTPRITLTAHVNQVYS